jgi:hypothetical protein
MLGQQLFLHPLANLPLQLGVACVVQPLGKPYHRGWVQIERVGQFGGIEKSRPRVGIQEEVRQYQKAGGEFRPNGSDALREVAISVRQAGRDNRAL